MKSCRFSTRPVAFEEGKTGVCLKGVVATCSFEPSTRTRLKVSETAVQPSPEAVLMEASPDANTTSSSKGRDPQGAQSRWSATMWTSSSCATISEGAARYASEVALKHPVINAGDGANQHPSQTMLDTLYRSIYKTPRAPSKISYHHPLDRLSKQKNSQ